MVKRYKPKKKSATEPGPHDDKLVRDLPPTKILSGGNDIRRKKKKAVLNNTGKAGGGLQVTSDMPKSFARLVNFVNKKKSQDEQEKKAQKSNNKKGQNNKGNKTNANNDEDGVLKIKPGESFKAFNRRVKRSMEKKLLQSDVPNTRQSQHSSNGTSYGPDGPEISNISERKRRNQEVRKEKLKRQKKKKGLQDDSGSEVEDDIEVDDQLTETAQGTQESAAIIESSLKKTQKQKRQLQQIKENSVDQDELEKVTKSLTKKSHLMQNASDQPRFNEVAEAPPVFTSLPKARFKKMVPIAGTKEAKEQAKKKEAEAIKKMITRTSRLTPLERMQQQRKAKLANKIGGDSSPAEKQALEIERQKVIQRYRAIKAQKIAANNNSNTIPLQ
ncbi:hypothetical protein H4219_005347 [Mycoemilia scoparia]|uniref:Coiled-coil domain-containing protein 137 n=1 Tax=Mycoemilia scoparia TaxID=417184 RepID=A0A9W7ZNB0_9FUNG|nr:hypothetical protein H4219_005347 [Mycoemilia scoparia]